MVQEKDAKEKRLESFRSHLQKSKRALDKNTLAFKWAVNEHKPGYNTGGYYDVDVPAVNKIVSPYFDTEAEAQEWMDAHEPDKGHTLEIVRFRLVRREWTEWVRY